MHELVPLYSECRGCNRILQSGAQECWECGSPPQDWEPWPPKDVGAFLELAHLRHGDDPRIRIVLLATVLEALLEDLLIITLHWEYASVTISELLLDAFRGFERRGRLFQELTGLTISDALTSAGYEEFFKGWLDVVRARNAIVHARLSSHGRILTSPFDGSIGGSLPSASSLDAIEGNLLNAFAQLRHLVKERLTGH